MKRQEFLDESFHNEMTVYIQQINLISFDKHLYILFQLLIRKQIQMKGRNTPISDYQKLYASNANHPPADHLYHPQQYNNHLKQFNHNQHYSKSYVFDKEDHQKEDIGIRKTINYDKQIYESNRKKKLNGFLRNTLNSPYSEKDRSQNFSSKIDKSVHITGYQEFINQNQKLMTSSTKEQHNKQSSYQKIIEKLSKKEKLINQLKELSKFNITDLIRKPQKDLLGQKKDNSLEKQIQEKQKYYRRDADTLNQTRKELFQTKKYDYSTAYNEKFYQSKKSNLEMSKNISDIHENIKVDLAKATTYVTTEKEAQKMQNSQSKNLYKSSYQKTPSSNIKQTSKLYNNVYYTPKQAKHEQQFKLTIKLNEPIDVKQRFYNEQIQKNDNEVHYKANRYFQTNSEPNTPLLDKRSNKTAKNIVQIKKVAQFNHSKDESNNYLSFKYLDTNFSEPNTPLLKKADSRIHSNIQDIRTHSQKRIKANSSYFTIGKPKIQDFQLHKELGQGKFGKVYQATHKQTKTIYALKKLTKKNIKQNMMIDQLIKEIKIQSFCNHENILKLYGFFDDAQYVYLILEYMEQGTLFQHLKKQTTFTQKQTASKIHQIALGIKYLHENGIIHRDIKPQNIVLSHGVGKLCDFGWATTCNGRRQTYCGTFDYVAPQILQGEQYDEAVDLWCLGVLAYQLLTGKAPFYHLSKKQTMKRILNVENEAIQYPTHLSKQTISFVDKLIRKNPEQRMTGKQILKHPFISNIKILQI